MTEQVSLFKRALTAEAEVSKEYVLDILFVLKQIIAAIVGIIISVSGLTGYAAFVAYATISSILVYLYVYRFLQVDYDVIETKDVLKEHFMNGAFMFFFMWIFGYNCYNFRRN